jgi:hypothetical protein
VARVSSARPSLDDVFLALTARPTAPPAPGDRPSGDLAAA